MKLVRDKIWSIDTSGKHTYRIASAQELPNLLADKLREEIEELIAKPSIDEYCDVASILSEFVAYHRITGGLTQNNKVTLHDQKKTQERGGFHEHWVQEAVVPAPETGENDPSQPPGGVSDPEPDQPATPTEETPQNDLQGDDGRDTARTDDQGDYK